MLMHKVMRSTLFLVFLILVVSAISACGGASNSDTPDRNAEVSEEAPTIPDSAEIVVHSPALTSIEGWDNLYAPSLAKKFPNYSFKVIPHQKGSTLPELLATKTRIDIFFHAIGSYENFTMPNNLQYDMTDLIKSHKVDLNRYEPTLIDGIRQLSGDGKLYSLPVYANNLVLFYNKTLFEKFGVPYPKDGMTWEQTIALANRMTRVESGAQYVGLTFAPNLIIRNNPLSIPNADLLTHTPTINTDERWQRFFRTLFVDVIQQTNLSAYLKENNVFANNNAFRADHNIAMHVYLMGQAFNLQAQTDVEWDLVSMPIFEGHPVGSQITPVNWGITSIAENKGAAMEVLKYLASDEFQTVLANDGKMPVLKMEDTLQLLAKSSTFKGKNYGAVLYYPPAQVPAKALYDAELITTYTKYGREVLAQNMDINTALRQADEEARKVISNFLAK